MTNQLAFPPVSNSKAKILILGSMPGKRSLVEQEYYAHPRNTFWPIICQLFDSDCNITYLQKKTLLLKNHIALWDVLKSCEREGSLDANIDHATIEVNDFNRFLKKHPQINMIFFNGGEAEKLFKRYVLKTLEQRELTLHKLPSTSPAHAAMSFDKKFEKWNRVLDDN